MNTYIWCVVGLIAGGVVALVGASKGKVQLIETVTMGIFGAVVGGDLVSTLFNAPSNPEVFRVSSLACSVAGAGTMLALLTLMRRGVGPMKPSKKKSSR